MHPRGVTASTLPYRHRVALALSLLTRTFSLPFARKSQARPQPESLLQITLPEIGISMRRMSSCRRFCLPSVENSAKEP
jgi:hypothetical protein